MTKHITVGYDGTSSSSEAVRWAAAEAAARGVALRVITCFDMPPVDATWGYSVADTIAAQENQAADHCAAMVASIRRFQPGLEVEPYVGPGPAAPVLVAEAQATDNELTVVGASGHHGASAFWLGSTPRRVIRQSSAPLVVVRGRATGAHPDRVIVGIDGSESADNALRWAEAEAARHGAQLVLVHGWSYPYLAIDAVTNQSRDLTRIDAACVLERVEQASRGRFGDEVTACLIESTAADALLHTATDGDMIVVGSRGRGALTSVVFGSTVNAVLEHAAVPVAVVHPVPQDRREVA